MMLDANLKEKPGLFIKHMGYMGYYLGADGGGMEAMYAAADELAQQQHAGNGSAAQPAQRLDGQSQQLTAPLLQVTAASKRARENGSSQALPARSATEKARPTIASLAAIDRSDEHDPR